MTSDRMRADAELAANLRQVRPARRGRGPRPPVRSASSPTRSQWSESLMMKPGLDAARQASVNLGRIRPRDGLERHAGWAPFYDRAIGADERLLADGSGIAVHRARHPRGTPETRAWILPRSETPSPSWGGRCPGAARRGVEPSISSKSAAAEDQLPAHDLDGVDPQDQPEALVEQILTPLTRPTRSRRERPVVLPRAQTRRAHSATGYGSPPSDDRATPAHPTT